MAFNKVEICNVDTSSLGTLKEEEKQEPFIKKEDDIQANLDVLDQLDSME